MSKLAKLAAATAIAFSAVGGAPNSADAQWAYPYGYYYDPAGAAIAATAFGILAGAAIAAASQPAYVPVYPVYPAYAYYRPWPSCWGYWRCW